jgi:hypothetical protein
VFSTTKHETNSFSGRAIIKDRKTEKRAHEKRFNRVAGVGGAPRNHHPEKKNKK